MGRLSRKSKLQSLAHDALIDGAWNEGINAAYLSVLCKFAKPCFPLKSFQRLVNEELSHHEFGLQVFDWALILAT